MRKLGKKQLRKLLREKALSASGWVGNTAETEWALFMQGLVKAKLAKLAEDDFQKFDQNWLSIYDNLPLPIGHLADAIAILKPLLKDLWATVPAFDTLFIERRPLIARITANESEHLVINDLWQVRRT